MIFILLIMVLFAVIGYAMAQSRGRSGLLWAIICLFTGLIGVVILAVIGKAPGSA